jgi:hypothetical protein
MALAKLDWEKAFDDWVMVFRPKGEITEKEYAKSLGISYTHLSHRFSEIRVQRISNKAKNKMAKVMIKSLNKMDEGLDELDDDEDVDAASKLRASSEAFKSTADRLGLSPQANVIQIQNNNQANAQTSLTVQPMFQIDKDDDRFRKLLEGE